MHALAARVLVVSKEFGSTGPVLRSGNGRAKFVVSLDFEVLPSVCSYAIGLPDESTGARRGSRMMLSKLLTAAAVVTMAATPVVAAPASKLSLSRASTASEKDSELAPAVIIGVLATAAIIGGAIALANNDDDPDSN